MDAFTRKATPTLPEFQVEEFKRPSRESAEAAVRTLIAWAGDNPNRSGRIDTPRRVVSAYEEFYSGYGHNAAEVIDSTFEDVEKYEYIVLVRDINLYSPFEHHMVPFVGKAHVAYFPTDSVVGLSKLARVVDVFGHRLQTQERMTTEIITAVDEALKPRGVAVMLESEHQCMTLRGVQKHGASTVTTQFTGVFRDDPTEQLRFMTLVRGGNAG